MAKPSQTKLFEAERYKIEALYDAGHTAVQIAAQIGRDRRTVERELAIGMVEQKRMNPSNKKYEPLYAEGIAYGEQNALDGQWVKQLKNASARARRETCVHGKGIFRVSG